MIVDTKSPGWKLPFAIIWSGQACSLFGSGVAGFALIWWLTTSTGSATVLATATLVTLLPGVLLGPLAGPLIDRWNRRAVLVAADAVGAVGAAVLALLFWAGALEIWHVYVVMAVRSLAGTFHFSAMQASTSLLVPEAQLARVAGLNQMVGGATNIAAPPLAALLLVLLPLHAMMTIDVVTALIAVATLLRVQIPQPPRAASQQSGVRALLAEMGAGLVYVRGLPGLLAVMGMATLINLVMMPAFALLPIMVTRHFGGGALELGWMNAAEGAGIVAGGLLLGVWGGFKRRILTAMLGLVGLSVGTLVIAAAPASALPLALVGMLLCGVMAPLCNGSFMAIVQSVVAPEMQGRVITLLMSVGMGAAPLGLLIAGPFADTLGVRLWYALGAAMCLAMAVVGLLTPAVLRIEERRATPAATGDPVAAPAAQ
ncbi:MAG: MFS transporter [Chloroflexales bacterium]|nr:MFS transporter [Chloroflexales bacterium]